MLEKQFKINMQEIHKELITIDPDWIISEDSEILTLRGLYTDFEIQGLRYNRYGIKPLSIIVKTRMESYWNTDICEKNNIICKKYRNTAESKNYRKQALKFSKDIRNIDQKERTINNRSIRFVDIYNRNASRQIIYARIATLIPPESLKCTILGFTKGLSFNIYEDIDIIIESGKVEINMENIDPMRNQSRGTDYYKETADNNYKDMQSFIKQGFNIVHIRTNQSHMGVSSTVVRYTKPISNNDFDIAKILDIIKKSNNGRLIIKAFTLKNMKK